MKENLWEVEPANLVDWEGMTDTSGNSVGARLKLRLKLGPYKTEVCG